MAHNGPVRLILNGDRAAAARYVRLGRVLLWKLAQAALVNGVKSARRAYPLPDEGMIEVAFAGNLATITITVGEGEKLSYPTEGFYLTWGGNAEADTPVMFLPPKGTAGEDGHVDWRASFFDAEATGFAQTPPTRLAPSYRRVFGNKAGESGQRLLHGNGMWTDPNTKETVAWFRGYTSYWPEHFRHPITNYSNAVSIYGHPVLALPDPAWRVLAAAKRENWLYVMVAEDLGTIEPVPPPAQPSYSGQVWRTQPYTAEPYTYSLRRYPLAVAKQPDTGIDAYHADEERGEVLWSGTLELAYGAWSFNRDCTACVTVQLPRIAVWDFVYEIRPEDDPDHWLPSQVPQETYPKVEALRIEIALTYGEGTVEAAYSEALAPALIAEEDGVTLEIVEADLEGGYTHSVECRRGELAVPLAQRYDFGGARWYTHRTLVFAHLPTDTLLFYRWTTHIQPDRKVEAGYELYKNGELVPFAGEQGLLEDTFEIDSFDTQFASSYAMLMSTGFDNGVVSFTRPMDAMTYLLGMYINTQGGLPATGPSGPAAYGYSNTPFVPHQFTDTLRLEHSGAGGWIFASVGGTPETLYWNPVFHGIADMYGANAGEYVDPEPTLTPIASSFSAAASTPDDLLAAVDFRPMRGLPVVDPITGDSSETPLGELMTQHAAVRAGTNGDAKTLLDAVLGENTRGFTLSHTGKPRKLQQRGFKWP